jgi:dolichyl-phosphate beta-glucosyltransferase
VPIRILRNGRNRGKGYSVKHGVLEARGEFVLVSDADFSTPIEDLPRLLAPIEARDADLTIGSRDLPGSRIEVRQPWWREAMGRTFNLVLRILTGLRYRDTQCGFKVLRRAAVLPLFRAARIERFAWDVEILHLAGRAGLEVREMPVRWRNAADSRVHPVRDAARMLLDTLRILWWSRRGRYGTIGRPPATGAGS